MISETDDTGNVVALSTDAEAAAFASGVHSIASSLIPGCISAGGSTVLMKLMSSHTFCSRTRTHYLNRPLFSSV